MLDVIVPCYNEEKVIEDFYNKTKESLKNIKHNFIFINDGSNDKTLEKLKNIYNNDKECIKIINFSRNFGKESAIQAGLKYSKGKYQCLIDADLQQNPKYLVKMYNFLEENTDYDCIAMCQKQHKKRFFQELFYKVMDKLSDIHIENGASDFRMFKHDVTKSILNLNEKNRFTKGIFSYVGYNTYYDTYEVEARKAGETKWSFKSLLRYAASGILAFSTKPLRFITYTGIITSFIAFVYLLAIFIKTLCLGIDTKGYASLMCVILFLGGLILLSLGIIGEYISKIYEESKERPTYIIKERYGFDEDIL